MQTTAGDDQEESPLWIATEPRWKGPPGSCGNGGLAWPSGYKTQTACWRARERPMAVMSGASRGALRRGR